MRLIDIFCRRKSPTTSITFDVHTIAHPQRQLGINTFPAVVGRCEQSDVQISDRMVSRTHCVIQSCADGIFIRDLESHHGTWVNGNQVDVKELHVGDELWMGTTQLVVTSIVLKRPAQT